MGLRTKDFMKILARNIFGGQILTYPHETSDF